MLKRRTGAGSGRAEHDFELTASREPGISCLFETGSAEQLKDGCLLFDCQPQATQDQCRPLHPVLYKNAKGKVVFKSWFPGTRKLLIDYGAGQ